MSSSPSTELQEAPPLSSSTGWGARPQFASAGPEPLRLSFTASGSEYFRIWIVNLLLTVVTLGLYYPWARVRKLRYFHGNTHLAGHAFDFHGKPSRMLRGYLLLGAMFIVYSVAGGLSASAGLIALLIICALWPMLLRSSQRFRLANTSWRGLRFQFTGSTADAYRAMLPSLLVVIVFLGVAPMFTDESGEVRREASAFVGLLTVACSFAGPWAWYALKKYQHDGYALGQEGSSLRTGVGSFYAVSLRAGGVALVCLAVALGSIAIITALVGGGWTRKSGEPMSGLVVIGAGFAIAYAVAAAVVGAYSTTRTQNLLWSHTASQRIRFDSDLRFGPMLGLLLKNWALVILTLGLYWPFARVSTARMRLQAISVVTALPLHTLTGSPRRAADDASGDAASEVFGIDIGL